MESTSNSALKISDNAEDFSDQEIDIDLDQLMPNVTVQTGSGPSALDLVVSSQGLNGSQFAIPRESRFSNDKSSSNNSSNSSSSTNGKKNSLDQALGKTIDAPDLLNKLNKKDVVPSLDPSVIKREKKKNKPDTAGPGWYGLPATPLTQEVKNDLKVLGMRKYLDPKRFYKKEKTPTPKYFQIGTVV
jgi:hypothetical protein